VVKVDFVAPDSLGHLSKRFLTIVRTITWARAVDMDLDVSMFNLSRWETD
jgi:hypothetical protein